MLGTAITDSIARLCLEPSHLVRDATDKVHVRVVSSKLGTAALMSILASEHSVKRLFHVHAGAANLVPRWVSMSAKRLLTRRCPSVQLLQITVGGVVRVPSSRNLDLLSAPASICIPHIGRRLDLRRELESTVSQPDQADDGTCYDA
jgi:hypothetical protein